MSVLNTLYQHAVSTPNKVAILGPRDESLTYSQLYECVAYLANYFNLEVLKSSLKTKRPRVCVLINDPVCNILIVLGLNFIGAEIVTLNPKLKSAQIEAFFKFTDAEYIFTDDEGAENLRFSAVPFENVIKAAKSQIKKKDTVLQISQKPEYNSPYEVDTPFLITLSSGSTGEPKPVIVTEKNKFDRAAQAVDLYEISSQDVILNASPFFHSLGQRLTFVPILTGATLVLLERFSVSRWIKSVESFGVTFTIAVSSHLHALVDVLCEKNQIGNLKGLVSSSAGLSIEAKKKLFEQSNFEFYEMYGATEIATATNQDRFLASKSIESVGMPCPGVEIAIFDENFKQCGEGEIGEICVKSPLTSPGYLNSTEKTALSFQYGFFRTGDLGFLDKENFLYLRGRKADLIISGGLNIFPQDIEEAIATYPAVLEVEVVGQPDDYLGEVAVAVIATESPANEIEPKIRKLLRSKLASYQQPTRYIFLDKLPYQANGKRDKVAIKRLVLSEN